jgi:hypothetical protein
MTAQDYYWNGSRRVTVDFRARVRRDLKATDHAKADDFGFTI